MKHIKKYYVAILITFVALVLSLAYISRGQEEVSTDPIAGKPSITTSFYPVYALARAIAGDNANVSVVTPLSVEPHEYEPSATDIQSVVDSDLFIYTGTGNETWAEGILATAQDGGTQILPIYTEEQLIRITDNTGKETQEIDTHAWLSPSRTSVAAARIRDALIALDDAHAAEYTANADAIIAALKDANAQYSSSLSSCKRKTFVTTHNAFGYIAKDYNLTAYAITGTTPESEPTPKKMAELIQIMKKAGVTTIFAEELASSKLTDTISRETGATVAQISPLETGTDIQDYFSRMSQNLSALKSALECK